MFDCRADWLTADSGLPYTKGLQGVSVTVTLAASTQPDSIWTARQQHRRAETLLYVPILADELKELVKDNAVLTISLLGKRPGSELEKTAFSHVPGQVSGREYAEAIDRAG